MDSGFETIIYIILGIIFVVAQVMRKKKKPAATPSSDEGGSEQTPSPARDLLEQFFGTDDGGKEVRDPFEPIESPQEVAQPLSSDYVENEKVSSKNDKTIGKETESYKEIKKISQNSRKSSKKKPGFDLRQAVIYSTIIERKHF